MTDRAMGTEAVILAAESDSVTQWNTFEVDRVGRSSLWRALSPMCIHVVRRTRRHHFADAGYS